MRGVPVWPHVSEELIGRHPHGQNHPQLSRMCVLCSWSVLSFRAPTCVSPADASLLLALHTDHPRGRQLSGVATVLLLNPIYNQTPGRGLGSELSVISKKMLDV